MAGLLDNLRALAGASVQRVTIRANLLPFPVVLDAPLSPDGAQAPAAPSLLGSLLRPSIDLETPLGNTHVAPYGEPSDVAGPVLSVVVVLAGLSVLGLAAFGLYTLAKE